MSDIREMLIDRCCNRNFHRCHTKTFHQCCSIIVRAVSSAESRHCDTDNPSAVKTEAVKGPYGNKQSKCGIKPSGNTHNKSTATYGIKTLCQTCNLYVQYLIATLIHNSRIRRDKRMRIDMSQQFIIIAPIISWCMMRYMAIRYTYTHSLIGSTVSKCGSVHSVTVNSLYINVGNHSVVIRFPTSVAGNYRAVLCYNSFPVKHQIGRGLAPPRSGIGICTQASGWLLRYQFLKIIIFAYKIIGCWEIEYHLSPSHSQPTRWWYRHPQILADLDTYLCTMAPEDIAIGKPALHIAYHNFPFGWKR